MIWALRVKDLSLDSNWDLIPAFKNPMEKKGGGNPMEETYINNYCVVTLSSVTEL